MRRIGLVVVAFGLAACGGERSTVSESPTVPPSRPVSGVTPVASSTPISAEPSVDGIPRPPGVVVSNGSTVLELAPWTYCIETTCADGFPPDPLPSAGTGDELEVTFPLAGWTFDAAFQRAGEPCSRTQTIALQQTGPTSFRLGPAGPAGSYKVELFGRGEGDLFVSFGWTTTVDGPMPEPQAHLGVLADNDGRVDSYGVELVLSNLAASPSTATATITVTAANGRALTFDPQPSTPSPEDCATIEGLVTWYGPDQAGHEAARLGPAPFTYDVVVTLDGLAHRAHAVWPDDVIPGNEPSVALTFHPALPALATGPSAKPSPRSTIAVDTSTPPTPATAATMPSHQPAPETSPPSSHVTPTTNAADSSPTSGGEQVVRGGAELDSGVPVRYEYGTHCGVRILGRFNGHWWRAREAIDVRGDWLPDEWAADPNSYGEVITVKLVFNATNNTIVATYRGRSVVYLPGPELEDWEYCA